MKKLIGLLILVGLLLMGCAQPSIPPEEIAPAPPAEPSPETIEAPPELCDKTWISPGKVMVGNFHPGARAEWSLTMHNGNTEPAQSEIRYREPGKATEGYIKAPSIVQEWVTIADPTPILAAKETREILIAVVMPEDAESSALKWEFWIAVRGVTQTGMIQTELASRWLVSMRD